MVFKHTIYKSVTESVVLKKWKKNSNYFHNIIKEIDNNSFILK